MATLASRLAHIRKARGLSMTELAGLAGISQATISVIESGKGKNLTTDTLQKLAEVLQVDISYFIGNTASATEMIEDALPHTLVEFILDKGSLPYLMLAKELSQTIELNQEALEATVAFLQVLHKKGLKFKLE